MSRKRNVAIVGIGQTYHKAHRPDVNQVELVHEAVRAALGNALLSMKDIDCVVHGNMELFEGIHQPDMWHVDGDGAFLKSGFRLTTGGTTGGTLVCAADHLVASGLFETVLAVGFEKQEEGHTTTGITAMADPLWGRALMTGAISGVRAGMMVREFGQRAELAAARVRVKAANNALKNPFAHLKIKITVDDVMKSRMLAYPLRFLHMCPESNGACALVLSSEEKAKEITKKPVWMKDHVTVHMEETFYRGGPRKITPSMEVAARKLYQRNGIKNPLEEIDVFEMYDPSSWWELEWMEYFLLLKHGQNIDLVEEGATEIDGRFPINPSGGVVSTNPIGATAMIRVAEAALQIRGDAGEHQVPKEVRRAMASSFGGTLWTILHLLTKEIGA
ncbi:MAG: thiolase family protein [Deltaproteobacteria bacterium]|nr:thiolase family protein [Deltaproteobacteria bacterium]